MLCGLPVFQVQGALVSQDKSVSMGNACMMFEMLEWLGIWQKDLSAPSFSCRGESSFSVGFGGVCVHAFGSQGLIHAFVLDSWRDNAIKTCWGKKQQAVALWNGSSSVKIVTAFFSSWFVLSNCLYPLMGKIGPKLLFMLWKTQWGGERCSWEQREQTMLGPAVVLCECLGAAPASEQSCLCFMCRVINV